MWKIVKWAARLVPGLTLCWFVAGPAPALGEPLADTALGYALYEDDVSWLARAPIDTPAALDEALDRAARHKPDDVTRGWIAYEALAATQSPAFVHGLQARVRTAGRAAVLRRLAVDLAYARNRPAGAGEAIQLVLQSSQADAARVSAAADRFTALGDTLRIVAWASAVETDQAARETRLRTIGAGAAPAWSNRLRLAPLTEAPLADPNAFGGRAFWDAVAGAPAISPFPASPRLAVRPTRAALVDRILTLAALRVLDATSTRTTAMLTEPGTTNCLTLTQLEFRQCVSVTQFSYENAFCLARHGLREPSACLGSLAS